MNYLDADPVGLASHPSNWQFEKSIAMLPPYDREKEKLVLAWLGETLPTLKRPLTSDASLGVGVK
ncbi:MAG: hypothetical protein EPO42_03580 [Gallionellaceae bacterium]|nr:MAG: hypothetical protein EPO42_03580 [Gallionellaceae bacterium]